MKFDAAGNLFGTTADGGANGFGTIFEIAKGSNAITTLASFNGANGKSPLGGVTFDTAGNLYGTTYWGGDLNCNPRYGNVFVVGWRGKFRVLHRFTGGADGATPIAGWLWDPIGNI